MASSSSSNNHGGKILKRAKPSSIQDKFLVGYQGWFTCGGDGDPVGPGHHGWLHWLNAPIPDGGHPNVDLWPDVSSYSPSELFPVPGLKTKTGDPVFLFSSRNAKTVQRHFHWMAEHGVDGAFLQRFVGQCDVEGGNEGIMRIRDEVGDRVQEAAEKEGRVFAIMYDVVGVAPDRILKILQRDWMHLIRNKGILDSPNYLRERGKPVVALWGFGFDNAKHTPELVRSVVQFFRNTTPGGVYIMAGTPSNWRTSEGDADPNPEFLNVWLEEFDAISPWTVGRYSNDQEADNFMESKMKGDVELINNRNSQGTGKKIDYIPVVLPGGSGFNTSEGRWGFNNIKRNGGRFLWKQIANAKRLGVRTMYGAMWDEYDEGTALMPAVEHKGQLPDTDKFKFMALDEDGYDIPADWYMRVCGFAGEGLRGERRIFDTFPVKELQDYWSSRPKFEEISQKSGEFVSGAVTAGGSGEGDGQTYQEWLAAQKDDKEDLPPPPYTFMSDEPEASGSTSAPASAPAPARASVSAVAPTPVPVGITRPEPASVILTSASAPAPAPVPGVASLTSNGPHASHTTPASFNNAPHQRPVSGYGNEADNAVTGHAHSYHPGAAVAGSTAATNQPQQPYYSGGGGLPPATSSNEGRQNNIAGGYASQSYQANIPNVPIGSPRPQQPYTPSAVGTPSVGQPQNNNASGYAPDSYQSQSGPSPNVIGNAPPQQPYYSGSVTGAAHEYQNNSGAGVPSHTDQASSTTYTPGTTGPHHPYSSDPVASLANDFSRQEISGGPLVGGNVVGRPGTSPPPLHPARPLGNASGSYAPANVYPGNQSQPLSQHGGRPQSASYSPNMGAPQNIVPNTPAQWPPKDWNINQQPSGAPVSNNAGSPLIPHSSHPQGPQMNVGGANLGRHGTFTGSTYGGAAASSLRPSASLNQRPPSRPPPGPSPSGNFPVSYGAASTSSSEFPSSHPNVPVQSYGGNSSPFPLPHPSDYNAATPSPMGFPGGPSAPYPPSMSSYQAPGGNSYSGSTGGSRYGTSGPTYSWPGGPANTSPPQSPGPGANFPGPDMYNPSRPYSPGGHNASFPSSSPYSTGGALGGPSGGGPGYSNMPGMPTYGSGSGINMPSGDASGYSSYGPGNQYNTPSTYPTPGGASSYPSPSPWLGGSGSGSMMPPPPPPRPANYSSNSSSQVKPSSTSNPSFPMASNALGYALSAVDKVAGRKTRDQLESQVGSIAQTGTKLFNKFTR